MPTISAIFLVGCSADAQTAARRLEGICPRGGNISDIDGAIRANGTANLFLINPAGIIFGEGASLDLGGSFYGSSASSILFEDGEFSAVDVDNPPLLTVNAPIGLNFRDNPGDIVNRSFVQNSTGESVGLEVLPGNNIILAGGNINFEAGEVNARGGNVELGGLLEAGTIDINENGSLSFPEDATKADINLSNAADIDVRGSDGGNITINSRNLSLERGEFGLSFIRSGINSDSTSIEAQAGNIVINNSQTITLNDARIVNQVDSGGIGNAGNIAIDTTSLEIINGGAVDASTIGQGDAGSVEITATENITFDGENSEGIVSGATSFVNTGGVGNGGDVTIFTNDLTLTNGGRVAAGTFGQGDAGSIDITATGDLTFDGESSDNVPSGVTSFVNTGGVGNGGSINISANNLTLTAGGSVSASTSGEGDAGSIIITAEDSILVDGTDKSTLDGSITSEVLSNLPSTTERNAGNIEINTSNLQVTDTAIIAASTFGNGNAGDLTIRATDSLSVTNDAVIQAINLLGGTGTSGNLDIETRNLTVDNGAQISASTRAGGDAGNLTVRATDSIIISGGTRTGPSALLTTAESGDGNGGELNIFTKDLNVNDDAVIGVGNFPALEGRREPGTGEPGDLNI